MLSTTVERVRGTTDVLPQDYEFLKKIKNELIECFETFGYLPIDVPIIEYTDLHLRKSGENIVSRMYDFTYQNRRLCLRPEMTASIVRAYIDGLRGEPLPVRLYNSGPVFRYEKPQWGRYRQFTQTGIELIGAKGAMADAEVIHIACKGLNRLNLTDYRLLIGHVGIMSEFLESLSIEGRLQNFLLSNMETLRKQGDQGLRERLHKLYPGLLTRDTEKKSPASSHTTTPDHVQSEKLADLFQGMDESDARQVLLDLLKSMNIQLNGSRDPDEIVDRLLTKIKRQNQMPRLNRALEFMKELGGLAGEPANILKEAEKLLAAYKIKRSPLDQLQSIFETLKYYNLDLSQIRLDLGLSRGIQYYTGMVFEIHHSILGEDKQLCGGGRYDDLITTLGSNRNTPAIGFGYGLERIHLALDNENKTGIIKPAPVNILIIPVSTDNYGYAVAVAEKLRQKEITVEIDVRGRSVKGNFKYADKRNIPFVAVIGSEEEVASKLVVKNLATRKEQTLSISEATDQIKKVKATYA